MTWAMFDSVNVNAFPAAGFDATAGYVNGLYANTAAIKARFPNLPHVTISVFASGDAMCLDVEPGDATPAEAPAWLDRQYARGNPLPILYCNTSQIAAVRAAVGSRPFLWWSASYTYTPHLDNGADATQWADKGPNGENVDQTLMSDRFFATIGGKVGMTPEQAAQLAELLNIARTGRRDGDVKVWPYPFTPADATLVAVQEVKAAVMKPAPAPVPLSDADVARIAKAVADLLTARLAS